MVLEIVTPEAILFKSEVTSVVVPGINGSFQMLNDHAPIVSLLTHGKVKIKGNGVKLLDGHSNAFVKEQDEYVLDIKGGTIEMNGNKIIILAD